MERLEGQVSVLAALQAGRRSFQEILLARSAGKYELADLIQAAEARGVPVRRVDDAELDAHGKSHGGVVAVAQAKPLATAEEIYRLVEESKTPAFLALFEGADDARNLGYLLRTAEALGAQAALVRRRAWDLDGGALSRSSSGSFERLAVALVGQDLAEVSELKKRKLVLLGAVPHSRKTIYAADLARPLILAVGGEKRGLSAALRDACDELLSIPTAGGPTSLAMTQAGAIVLAEAARQRAARR